MLFHRLDHRPAVASSREDAWIETALTATTSAVFAVASSREDAWIETLITDSSFLFQGSRPPARTRGLKLNHTEKSGIKHVASSREDAWIETGRQVAAKSQRRRVLPRGRVD